MHRRALRTLIPFVVALVFTGSSFADKRKDPFNVSLCLASLVPAELNAHRVPVPLMAQVAEFGFGSLLGDTNFEERFGRFEYESFVFHSANGFQVSTSAEIKPESLVGLSVAGVSSPTMLMTPHLKNHNVTLVNASGAQASENTTKYDLVLAQGHFGSLAALGPVLKKAHSLRKERGELRFRLILPSSVDLISALGFFKNKQTADPVVAGIKAWLKENLGNTSSESFALMLTGTEYEVELHRGMRAEISDDGSRYSLVEDSRYVVDEEIPIPSGGRKGSSRIDRRRVRSLERNLVMDAPSPDISIGHGASVALTVIVRGVEPSFWDSVLGLISSEWASVW